MRYLTPYLFVLTPLALSANDFTLRVIDESGQPVADAELSVVLDRINDPRYASNEHILQRTDGAGSLHFTSRDDMCLARIDVKKSGHYPCLLDHRQHLSRFEPKQTRIITLPHRGRPIPLVVHEVYLSDARGPLPEKTWLGFDLEEGDLVAPHGKGVVTDFRLWLESTQDGWNVSPEDLRKAHTEGRLSQLSERDFTRRLGHWNSVVRLEFPEPGTGIMVEPRFWPYCELHMPPNAPEAGYLRDFEQTCSTRKPWTPEEEASGMFLRTRVQLAADGSILSAHYAKIMGRIQPGACEVKFRSYYNPAANDRNLEFDANHNLRGSPLRPGALEVRDP